MNGQPLSSSCITNSSWRGAEPKRNYKGFSKNGSTALPLMLLVERDFRHAAHEIDKLQDPNLSYVSTLHIQVSAAEGLRCSYFRLWYSTKHCTGCQHVFIVRRSQETERVRPSSSVVNAFIDNLSNMCTGISSTGVGKPEWNTTELRRRPVPDGLLA